MNIFITGGSGYIARNLKPLLEPRGHTILAPSHAELDILNFEMLDKFFRKNEIDAIIHTATRDERKKDCTYEEMVVSSIKMFENLIDVQWWNPIPIIFFGSGAEFDRRDRIIECPEENLFTSWPIDSYGLAKNIVSKRALTDVSNVFVLRLFAVFNFDEDSSRFIKNSILNLKKGLPIEIHQNKKMDFFYLDDVFAVIDYILSTPIRYPKNINMVYPEKVTLLDIAGLIHKHMNVFDPVVKLNRMGEAYDYTGSGKILSRLPIKLIGLEEGIRRTIDKLL